MFIGFLVAEIFSRYYAKEISMHSFDNGNSVKSKKDNWLQLMRIFKKIGLSDILTDDQAHHIASLEEGAAISFISCAYETLTQRKIQYQAKRISTVRVAGYQRDISLTTVRKAIKVNDIREDNDALRANKIINEVVTSHSRKLQTERFLDPERYSISSKSYSSLAKASLTSNDYKETTIVNQNNDEYNDHFVSDRISNQDPNDNDKSNNEMDSQTKNDGIEKAIFEFLSRIFTSININIDRKYSTMYSKFHSISGAMGPKENIELDEVIANELKLFQSSSIESIIENVMTSMSQYWILSDFLSGILLQSSNNSLTFQQVCLLFETIGYEFVKKSEIRNDNICLAIFNDFTFPKLVTTICSDSNKRTSLIRILSAFAGNTTVERLAIINQLKATISDYYIFLSCITTLASIEMFMDEELFSHYFYFASMSLQMPSPKIRACSMKCFSIMQEFDENRKILQLLLHISKSSIIHETWWEVQVYLLNICSNAIIKLLDSNQKYLNEYGVAIFEMILLVFHIDKTVAIKTYGISYLAPLTGYYSPFDKCYFEILCSLEFSSRQYLLGLNQEQRLQQPLEKESKSHIPQTQMRFKLQSSSEFLPIEHINTSWNPMAIAMVLCHDIEEHNFDKLSMEQIQILHACIISVTGSIQSKSIDELSNETPLDSWIDLFHNLKAYIYLSICDGNSSLSAISILSSFIFASKLRDEIFKDPLFISTLRLLYNVQEGYNDCQYIMNMFLRDIFAIGNPFDKTIYNTLLQFEDSYPDEFNNSKELREIMSDFRTTLKI